ncbi:uncharacterized protein K452DRAFT_235695 [Aplosporella prunicola CBS 121167]|uniref:Autophagy-related protein n=1 Tax=Aplosporella prunicola CBS 121167 TaxID=1176127 RepID=A0A6A6B270_9PEZI|nr:uncharacterized protein K452DRAFT_235695 [Aplosporella prunicola CBS 121167]KAF2137463.1 hypothetical protein K452DRAFT_235695 [Aplosporella prunicola CBS 121167]
MASEEGIGGFGRRRPQFEGDDTTPTTDRELKGWYSYGIAAEVFAVCGVGSFLPVTLEQLARERGVLRTDGVTSCMDAQDKTQCVVYPFGRQVSTASFAMYTFSIAVFFQALVLVSFSAVADHGTYRKKFLLTFAYVGAAASMLFIVVSPSLYLLGSLLVIIGVASLGSSFVLLNSFLPLLAANDPSVTTHYKNVSHDDEDDDTSYDSSSTSAPELALSNKISSKGVGLGYIAAVFVQVLSIGLLFGLSKVHFSSSSIPLRSVLFLVGLWWAVFTIPCALWLRDRPAPPLASSLTRKNRLAQVAAYIGFAWKSVWTTIKTAAQLRQTLVFLLAWFLLSDAIATVSGTAILFARTELKMDTVPIAILSITATSSGIAGAFIWPLISRRYDLPTHKTIVACIFLMQVIPIYGLMAYIPFVKKWGVGGLQQTWEIYPLGVVHGFVMGGLSSYCRSFFGTLVPPGSEAAFFALYAVTDKGSSAIGPAIVGAIVDRTGGLRPAFLFLAALIAAPVPLVLYVNPEKGRADARALARRMAGGRGGGYERVSAGETEDE